MKRIITIVSWPVVFIVEIIAKKYPHNKKVSKVVIGITMIYVGSFLGHFNVSWFPDFLKEAVGDMLKALGVAPLADHLQKKIWGEASEFVKKSCKEAREIGKDIDKHI